MALPKQVQAQMAELEELEKKLSTRVGEPPADTETTTPEKPKAPPEKGEQTAPESKPAEPQPAATAAEEESFKQKYQTLRGKFDSTVGPLNDRVRALTTQIEQLQRAAQKPQETPKAKEPEKFVTDADRVEFGEDLLDVQRRVAREVSQEYAGKIEQLSATITELRSQLNQTGQTVGEMSFAQKLQHLVPNFSDLDKDPKWAEWLNVEDTFTRAPRRNAAQAAFNKGDADAVAHYVALFKQSLGSTAPIPEDKSTAELARQVNPSTSNSSRTSTANRTDKKVYTNRDMDAAWGRVRELNSRGKGDEAARLETELTAAYMEGRVRA